MSERQRTGAEAICQALEILGIRHVFGLPGSQTLPLFEALRRSRLRTVTTTHELAATFAAGAYFRTGGQLAAVVTIPGPGFTYALTGLAEARLDSAALIHISGAPARGDGHDFPLQAIDQARMAAPVVKGVFDIHSADEAGALLQEAATLALSGEPGPVLVQVDTDVFGQRTRAPGPSGPAAPTRTQPSEQALSDAIELLSSARKPVILAGQGAAGAAEAVQMLAEALRAPVVTTPSARGLLPEDHELAMGFDPLRGDIGQVNALAREADAVLVIGCKLGHNGTAGFRLQLTPDTLIRVDTDAHILSTNFEARVRLHSSTHDALEGITRATAWQSRVETAWTPALLKKWRDAIRSQPQGRAEPRIHGIPGGSASSFFVALREALPRDAILVTDTGMHQILARRHFQALVPRGFLFPSDFQSMGFGLPAAIGAKLAAPDRTVVAVVGDGSMLMSGMEVLTAVREGTALTVAVFNDGQLNQIRFQQLQSYGATHGVRILPPDFHALARSTGAEYEVLEGNMGEALRRAFESRSVTVAELRVGDSTRIRQSAVAARARRGARALLPDVLLRWLRRAK